MNPLQILENVGAVVRNTHAVGTTGVHLDTYVQILVLRDHPEETTALCHNIAGFADDVDVVVGPAGGADFIVREVAHQLSSILGHEVHVVLAKKVGGDAFEIPSEDQHLVREKRVLVVDDVLNTGSTLQRILAIVRTLEGRIVGVGVVCSHGIVNAGTLGVPWLYAAATIQSRRWTPKECRLRGLCKERVPINPHLGHGAKFLASKPLKRAQ